MMFYTVIFQYALSIHLNFFFFAFAFFRKQFSFPFHLTNYLPISALVLASVWWGVGGGARVGKMGKLHIFLHFSILETMWEFGIW